MSDWSAIEAAAREQNRAELETVENTPLAFGQHIAWGTNLCGRTNGFSVVHSVGFPQHQHPYTTCGERIPVPILWMPLSPALIRTMDRCNYCDAETKRIAREKAA